MKLIPKYLYGGGTKAQYDNVTQIYQALVDKGINPQAALELTNQKVSERGWSGYSTGDKRIFKDAGSFANHIIDWHGRMYPDSLKATTFEEYFRGINGTPLLWKMNKDSNGKKNGGRYFYNSEFNTYDEYKNLLKSTRPGVKRRINLYRLKQGLSPLAFVNTLNENNYDNSIA